MESAPIEANTTYLMANRSPSRFAVTSYAVEEAAQLCCTAQMKTL